MEGIILKLIIAASVAGMMFPCRAQMMSSQNYRIDVDSINFGGGKQTSANYKSESTAGEIATGISNSANYKMSAGYQAMIWDYLPSLTFAITDGLVNLGTLTNSSTGADTAAFTVATNAGSGYVADISGSTLTNGDSDTITAIGGSKAASSVDSEQFGLNLKDNTTPNIGSEASGGSGAAAGEYATADSFAFQSGDTIASASGPSDTTTFTASFIANIAGSTEPGTYTTTLTLVATGKF